ncbi:MAG TPA: GAF domain-containing protein [Candidatus Dormibacteraeota bacterium]
MSAVQQTASDGLEARELRFLQRLATVAAATQRPEELVDLVIRETTSALGTDVCSLYLVEPGATGRLILTATNGLRRDMVGRVAIPIGQGVTGWVAQTREPALVPDVSIEPRWKWVPGLDRDEFRSMLSVPVEAGPRLVGVLNVQTVERRNFHLGDVDFLRAIAGQVAGTLERSEMHRRLVVQLAEVELSQTIHESFTQLALEGGGPAPILAAIAKLAGGRPRMYAPDGHLLVGSPGLATADRQVRLPVDLLLPGVRERRIKVGKPAVTVDVIAVRDSSRLFGFLIADVADGEVPAARHRALEHGATILALEMSKERATAEIERRLRGDLVEELLTANLDPEEAERLARQAERLGHHLPRAAWVVVVELDGEASTGSLNDNRLDNALGELRRAHAPNALVLARTSSAVVILPVDAAPQLTKVEELVGGLLRRLERQFGPASAWAGVGSLVSSVEDLSRSYSEARQALRLLRRAGGAGRQASYRSLGVFRLLLEVQRPEAVRSFVQDVLGGLLSYGQNRSTPLVETLEALVDAHWIRTAAARRLGIHVNSLTYRIARIEELIQLQLSDPEARVAVSIALQAQRLLADTPRSRSRRPAVRS